jgi:hypothetical protein
MLKRKTRISILISKTSTIISKNKLKIINKVATVATTTITTNNSSGKSQNLVLLTNFLTTEVDSPVLQVEEESLCLQLEPMKPKTVKEAASTQVVPFSSTLCQRV